MKLCTNNPSEWVLGVTVAMGRWPRGNARGKWKRGKEKKRKGEI
jgi:hypothetical protein